MERLSVTSTFKSVDQSYVTIQMKHLCQNFFIVLFISRDFTKRNLNFFRGDRVEAMDPSFDFHIVLPNSQL